MAGQSAENDHIEHPHAACIHDGNQCCGCCVTSAREVESVAGLCRHGVPLVTRVGGPSAYCEPCADACIADPGYYADARHLSTPPEVEDGVFSDPLIHRLLTTPSAPPQPNCCAGAWAGRAHDDYCENRKPLSRPGEPT